jgi:hypothetical protein
MSAPLLWPDLVLRLALTVLAGVLLGYNRSEHGKAAGMRTMLLVCLAASVAMIQVNILLAMVGRPKDSFVMNDLMRLPLGILTGVGFIGAGAIPWVPWRRISSGSHDCREQCLFNDRVPLPNFCSSEGGGRCQRVSLLSMTNRNSAIPS